jgi:hypothetical protein
LLALLSIVIRVLIIISITIGSYWLALLFCILLAWVVLHCISILNSCSIDNWCSRLLVRDPRISNYLIRFIILQASFTSANSIRIFLFLVFNYLFCGSINCII